MKISIYVNDEWADDGKLRNGLIEDCAAELVLGDQDATEAAYVAIESAIADGLDHVEHGGATYSWETGGE